MEHGWSSQRQGYLSESENAYSLALFCKLTDQDPRTVRPLLKKNPGEYFSMAIEDLRDREDLLDHLRQIRPLSSQLPPILSLPPSTETHPKDEPTLTLAQVEDCQSHNPWFAPLLSFYGDMVNAQAKGKLHEQEFVALDRLPPPLRHAILLLRFEELFVRGGLQAAIILEEAQAPQECERMLKLTSEAFDWLDFPNHAAFLRKMIEQISAHFELVEQAERDNSWEEFLSPLDQDEEWHAMDKSWDHELRKQVRRHAEQFVYE